MQNNIKRTHTKDNTKYNKKPNTINEEHVKIIALGGLGEIGKNMTVFEYKNECVIIDMGLRFPEVEDMPGIDFIIPNIQYFRKNKKRIHGVIVTHGHLDHTGAIPYLAKDLGYPTIYTMPLTRGMILKRSEEFQGLNPLDIKTLTINKSIKLGPFTIEPFHQNHNIPDSIGVSITTPVGQIICTGDFKFDFEPVGDKPADLASIARLGQKGVLLLMSDSTGAEKEGHSLTEKGIQDNLEVIFESAPGRLIVATFSSLITRIQEIINLSEKHGRKVVVEGYSMKTNVQLAKDLGYLKINRGTLVTPKQIGKMDPKQLTIICTGAQGETGAALMRIVSGSHRFFKIQNHDTMVLSSSVIPGNERAVQGLKDDISRQGAKVYHNQMMDVHAGGHAQIEDLKMMISLLRPKYFIPMHGNYSMLVSHSEIAQELGLDPKNTIVAENGEVIRAERNLVKKTEQKVPVDYVMVDGLGVGDVGQIVLRDRITMAQDGMFVIVAMIDAKTGKARNNIDIISRGFVYLKESKKLLTDTRTLVKKILDREGNSKSVNFTHLRDALREEVGSFLFAKTRRRPMVLPVVTEV